MRDIEIHEPDSMLEHIFEVPIQETTFRHVILNT